MPQPYLPNLIVEVGFDEGWFEEPSLDGWTRIDTRVKSCEAIPCGRSTELTGYSTGSLALLLETFGTERTYDPLYADGDYFGLIKPDMPIRVRAELPAAVTLFEDEFAGSALGAKWQDNGVPGAVTVGSGSVTIGETAVSDFSVANIVANEWFQLDDGASLTIELVDADTYTSVIGLTSAVGIFYDEGPSLLAFGLVGTDLSAYVTGPLDGDASTPVTYNSTDHRWLRIRIDGTDAVFETAPDGSTWTTFATMAIESSYGMSLNSLRPFASAFNTAGQFVELGSFELTHNRLPVWSGFVDTWRHRIETANCQIEITATDAMRILNGRRLPESVYESVVLGSEPLVYLKLGEEDGAIAADSTPNKWDFTYGDVERAVGSVLPYSSGGSVGLVAETRRAAVSVSSTYRWDVGAGNPLAIEVYGQAETDAMSAVVQDYTIAMQGDSVESDNRWHVAYRPLGSEGELYLMCGAATNASTWWFAPKLDDGRRHHIAVGITAAGAAEAYVDGVRLEVEIANSTAYPITEDVMCVGAISGVYRTWLGQLAHLAVYDNARPADVSEDHYGLSRAPWKDQFPGQRLHAILDLVDWPTGLRAIEDGNVLMGAADPAGVFCHEYAQLIANTEQGRYFVDAAGRVRLDGNTATITGESVYTFTDDGTGTGILNGGLSFSLDNTFTYDEAVLQRKYGQPQRAIAEGVTTPTRTYEQDGLLGGDDRQVRAAAGRIVYRYGTAKTRADQFQIDPENDPEAWATILRLGVGSVITLNVTPNLVGDPIELKLFVEYIAHDITPEAWLIDLWGSPTDESPYFTIGVAGRGIGEGVIR